MRERPAAMRRGAFKLSEKTSVRQRIGPKLDVHGARPCALAAFLEPRCAVAVRAPQPAAFPAGVRIVDTPVEALGVEAERIGNPDRDHLAVLQRHEAVAEIGGGHRYVLAKSEGVVLVDPGVITRLGAVLTDTFEARAGILIDRPALRAMIAGGVRSIERAFALAAVEAAEVATRQRRPDHAVLVDVAAADSERRRRNIEQLRQSGRRVKSQDPGGPPKIPTVYQIEPST